MVTAADNIRPVRIEEEMRTSYLSYAMSVIVARALPDVRDGLKPVQRRILYAMHELGMRPTSAYKKSARIVGEVLGKYHPHGDSPVYEALVRMAQDFSFRYPLVDGQGNFGSIDNDPPAAMRYTEARLASIAEELLADIELNTVDFAANFDGSLEEPKVLPALLPNMLVNGASGIAVGMATNIPPHNLGEICDAISYLIDHPDAVVDELIERVPGPDFPTRAIIQGRAGILDAYTTGRGRVVMQARTEIEEPRGGRQQIVVTELPFQVNKAGLVEKIATLTREKKIEGISDIRDESDRHGIRVVVELKRDAQAEIVLNNLYRHTALRSSFNVLMLALVDGQPQVLGLKRALHLYIEHRRVVIRRRSEHLLKVAKERAHIVEGLRLALDRLDEVIEIIRGSQDAATARENLVEKLDLSAAQAQAILDMQLRRLAALEREKLEQEYADLLKTIGDLEALLADPGKILAAVKEEVRKLKKRFADPRRTEIRDEEAAHHTIEELTLHQDVVITLSRRGYIKRIPISTYKLQHRGGKGVRGMTTRDDDSLQEVLAADTHDLLLFFTNRGRVYSLKSFEIAGDASRTSRGTLLVNLVPLSEGERVSAVLPVRDLRADGDIFLTTRRGAIKAMRLKALANIRRRGILAMNLKKGDELVAAGLTSDPKDVIIVTEKGQSIRFSTTEVPLRSRNAGGVRGIRLQPGDKVVSMGIADSQWKLLAVSQGGYGKCTLLSRYRKQSRGGSGTRTFRVTQKTGRVAVARVVGTDLEQEIMLISAKAQVIRISLDDVHSMGRNTQGVIVWRDKEPDDYLVSITCLPNGDAGSSSEVSGNEDRPPNGTSARDAIAEPGPEPDQEEEDSSSPPAEGE